MNKNIRVWSTSTCAGLEGRTVMLADGSIATFRKYSALIHGTSIERFFHDDEAIVYLN